MWTVEQVRSLAPDVRAAEAADALAVAWRWSDLGQGGQFIWGACRGSRDTPYRTQVDFKGPSFTCDCPSSKRPCKHGIALLLLYSKEPERFSIGPPPTNTPRADKPSRLMRTTSPERDARVSTGIEALQLWLEDLLRQGLARRAAQMPWDETAARMVDFQMPGVARVIRQMGRLVAYADDWPAPVVERIGRLSLLCQAWKRIDSLDEREQADVRTAIGFTVSHDDVLQGEGVEARWNVVGQFTIDEEHLRIQRTWLWAPARQQMALVLGFSRGEATADRGLMPGTAIDARLAFFPGAAPLRAVVQAITSAPASLTSLDGDSVETAVQRARRAVALNPWLELHPLVLDRVLPIPGPRTHWIQDDTGRLAVHPDFDGFWSLLARSGGHPLSVAGEWDGELLRPLISPSRSIASFANDYIRYQGT